MSRKRLFLLFLSGYLAIVLCACSPSPKGIKLAEYSLELKTGEEYMLDYTLEPSNAKGNVTFSSSDYAIVNVIEGKLVATAPGKATITVSTENNITTACNVTVTDPPATELFSEKELAFYQALTSIVKNFNVPSSVRVVRVYIDSAGKYITVLNASNRLGVTSPGTYKISVGSISEFSGNVTASDPDISVDLINRGLEEYWS